MRSILPRGVLAVVTLIAGLLVASTATKSGDVPVAWRVLTLAGHAQARLDDAPFHALALGDTLPPGTEIVTDAGSKMTIAHGKDRLMVAPATRLQIARRTPGSVWDRLLQSFGSVIYDVEPRKDRTFGVDSPYLAAVVKGTRFEVTVHKDLASVHVERGKVEVASSDGVAKILLQAGQTAGASPSSFRGLQVSSAGAPAGTEALNGVPIEGMPSESAGTSPTGAVTGTVDAVGGVADGTVASVTGAVNGTVSAVNGAENGTVGAVGGVANAATGAVNGAVGAATGAVNGAVGGVTGAVGATTGAVGATTGAVSDAVGAATGTVGGTVGVVGGVTGAVGGVVGGLTGSSGSGTSSGTGSGRHDGLGGLL